MKILIDILHPAHVYFFMHFRQEVLANGHQVMVTAREKEVSIILLENFGIPYYLISRQKTGKLGLAREMLIRTWKLINLARDFQPDVMAGIMGPSITVAGKILGIPSVVFYDTEFAQQTNWFAYRLAHSVCTPACYSGKVNGRHVTYDGYHELAYLHPTRFMPNIEVLNEFGITIGERYAIVRFVSWSAIHDSGEVALDSWKKKQIVKILSTKYRVLITSERELPDDLEAHRLRGPAHKIHHIINYADLLVGESATMASEAAVLGVPSVFIAKTGRGYTDEQEKYYGLVNYFRDDQYEQAIDCIRKLASSDTREFGRKARSKLLLEKIDVTEWMIKFFKEEFS